MGLKSEHGAKITFEDQVMLGVGWCTPTPVGQLLRRQR